MEQIQKGALYLCPTPIGNLEDITLRTLNVLKNVDLIAAEDTRHSLGLLNYFEIKKPLVSYFEHNKLERGPELIEKLKTGTSVALVTDAGTPAISDPGEDLVRLCIKEGVKVIPLPGANAALTALIASGISTARFCFQGFLPVNKKERKERLTSVKNYIETLIFYEAPHKLKATLKDLKDILGDRNICLCRELTKKFEEFIPCSISQAEELYRETDPRGEYVVIVEGCSNPDINKETELLSLEEIYQKYLENGIDYKEAIKLAAKDKNISKREAYDILKK
ncbi:MAG: 16S rRNA (cytidine(1402)-2'-O)-methyltransferase [Clostridia bacterium]|nr:16S rRNA (cytidine(1402)-2'-O)-methyltransferase [Clostridia bacterium]